MDDPEVSLRCYIEKIIDERHKLYEAKFDALEKHTALTLAALQKGEGKSEWGFGVVVAIGLALLSAIVSWVKK